ncbi:RidA family protein [Streptomyces sp. NBC_01497]|uniref:RidA family protein n=1 Tax=Streptomyces sp. NBC_01497 TaxID=2903885 RepID=UPI002E33A66C|nr:Rid family hydrolase [Streptomyces sp. NBC_01497]
MKSPESINAGISHQIGRYADAVRVPAGYDTIVLSGTPGLTADGTLPESFADEATQAWRNVEAILSQAGAGLSDIISIRQWFISPDDIAAYVPIRTQFIKHEPASMLAVIPALVWPQIRVEIEVVAAVLAEESKG